MLKLRLGFKYLLCLFFDIQDCPHVSRTLEEFYTVRCQVTDMKNLYVSFQNLNSYWY